jgi:hypothetical protein
VSASLPTAANFGVSVQSTERKEDEQRKSKRERKAESSSNDVREPVTHDVSSKTRGECPNHPCHVTVTIPAGEYLIEIKKLECRKSRAGIHKTLFAVVATSRIIRGE